jgi:hypothetical protein
MYDRYKEPDGYATPKDAKKKRTEMIPRNRRAVPPKLGAGKSRKINLIAEEAWLDRIDEWRKRQPWPSPTRSDAIRRLVDRSLDADENGGDKPKPKKSKPA